MTATLSPTFLSIPAELRNHIYDLLFPPPSYQIPEPFHIKVPTLASFGQDVVYANPDPPPGLRGSSAVSSSCRQLQCETQALFLGTTLFRLSGVAADPIAFAQLAANLSPSHRHAVRHIVLSARISHLRALNESWNNLPFGSEDFFLETLTIVPRRPEIHEQAWAEVADLSQSHTLAYILGETLKGLRRVGTVVVRNEGCFNDVIWQLTYRSLIFRLWKWGGRLCELKVCEDELGGAFSIRCCDWPTEKQGRTTGMAMWRDIAEELNRLVGEDDQSRAADPMI